MSQKQEAVQHKPAPTLEGPYSQQAEEAVLGAILIDPDYYIKVASFLKPEDFFFLKNRYIWTAAANLFERREPIDHITIADELDNMQVLDTIGGRAYLMQVINNAGTSMYAEVYGRLVERTSIRRKAKTMADNIKALADDESLNIETVVNTIQEAAFNLKSSEVSDGPKSLYEELEKYYDHLEAQMQGRLQKSNITLGTPTGFRDIDSILGGFHKSDFVTLAGRPGTGKTSLMLNLAANVGRLGGRVMMVSLEMPSEQFVMRLISMETGVNVQTLRNAQLSPQEAQRVTEAIGRISQWHVWIWDVSTLTVNQLSNQSRRIKYEYGLDLLLVDYVQLMTEPSVKNNRVLELSHITRNMKALAKDLNITLVQGAQLNRELESRKDKRPMLSDLRESGSIENDSDIVMMLYRDEMYNENTEFPNQADLIVAKHRNGPTGVVSLYFEKSLTKFMDASVHRVDLSGFE